MMRSLCRRLRWLSITLFGAAVEPDVYWRNASVSLVTDGARQAFIRSLETQSVFSQHRASRPGDWLNRFSTSDIIDVVVRATAACASATIAWSREVDRLRRGG